MYIIINYFLVFEAIAGLLVSRETFIIFSSAEYSAVKNCILIVVCYDDILIPQCYLNREQIV